MDRLDLTDLSTYAESCLRLAEEDLAGLDLIRAAAVEDEYNAYPGYDSLEPPRHLLYLEDHLNESLLTGAVQAVLEGKVFWEHTAAGEATRLGLGPKFLINPGKWPTETSNNSHPGQPLLPLSLGVRHLTQWAYEISCLALEAGHDPQKVLARQQSLLVINEDIKKPVLERVRALSFLGLDPSNFLFLVQPTFPGLTPVPSLNKGTNKEQSWQFDQNTPKRLHNHGQMAMQKTMDGQVFCLDQQGQPRHLSWDQFRKRLGLTADLVSYNIEDLDYLNGALDLETIGLALNQGEQGRGMVMEIVANNPHRPVRGGACFYDPRLGRDVVIEDFRLRGQVDYPTYLNKNFNHYPQPAQVFSRLQLEGLFMPLAVTEQGLYFKPVQGDLNFLVDTAFVTRRIPKNINSWKTPADTKMALEAMSRQDSQSGFLRFLTDLGASI